MHLACTLHGLLSAMKENDENTAQLPAASPMHLGELVDFAPGSIVSRTLVENNAGSVTLFSFDRGQGLSTHTAPFKAFVQMIEGTGEFRIGDDTITAIRGDVLLMPARVPHAVKARERFKMLLTMLRPDEE